MTVLVRFVIISPSSNDFSLLLKSNRHYTRTRGSTHMLSVHQIINGSMSTLTKKKKLKWIYRTIDIIWRKHQSITLIKNSLFSFIYLLILPIVTMFPIWGHIKKFWKKGHFVISICYDNVALLHNITIINKQTRTGTSQLAHLNC